MASTYSNLKIELMGTGDQSGTWGTTTNTNLGTAIEEAITGTADVTFASADVTLTLTNTNTAQTARNLRLNLVGTVSAAQNLIVPAIEKQYIVNNTLGYDITVKNSTGTGIVVPAGKSMILFNTGTNVTEAVTYTNSLVYPGAGIPNSTGTAWGTSYTTSGSGTVVALATSPTLTTPTLTSPTLTTPILGTPQSGTLTSCTGLPLTTGVTGTLPIANGGTGSTSTTYVNLASNVTGTLPVANGGTGLTSLTTGNIPYGNGTGALSSTSTFAMSSLNTSVGIGGAPINAVANGGAFSYNYGSIELGNSTTILGQTATVTGTTTTASYIFNNVYLTATPAYVFRATGYAGIYQMFSSTGQHSWESSTVSGTAGNTVSPTRLMTLYPSGGLALGTGSSDPGAGALKASSITGLTTPLSVSQGGTGASTQTAYSVLCGGTTSTGAYQSVASVGTAGQVLTSNGAGALPTFQTNGNGTVTSVSWTGGIVSVATSTTTPAFTIAGTSGGIPYFSSGTTWASSAVLDANALVIGGGAGAAPSTTTTGTGVITALGIAANGSGGFVTNTGTVTLTNKRITSRSLSLTSTSGAITPDSDTYDQVNYSLTGSSSFSNPSGTPTNGQKLTLRLYAASTQTISSWSSSTGGYRAIGVTLPTSVPAGKTIYVGCIWNSTDSRWDVIAVAIQV
jgi:hypothetical protein